MSIRLAATMPNVPRSISPPGEPERLSKVPPVAVSCATTPALSPFKRTSRYCSAVAVPAFVWVAITSGITREAAVSFASRWAIGTVEDASNAASTSSRSMAAPVTSSRGIVQLPSAVVTLRASKRRASAAWAVETSAAPAFSATLPMLMRVPSRPVQPSPVRTRRPEAGSAATLPWVMPARSRTARADAASAAAAISCAATVAAAMPPAAASSRKALTCRARGGGAPAGPGRDAAVTVMAGLQGARLTGWQAIMAKFSHRRQTLPREAGFGCGRSVRPPRHSQHGSPRWRRASAGRPRCRDAGS